ncbi:MAG: hypothetical protein K8F35_10430 [Dokdonella sp.]|uniref:hypothetical protein n=1 Tax=Dokdonella sp. TaxID=2291710 RepID=UPI0025C168E4|nr:hypothetical protein [Dokdonella sp.]MBZ0223428.1 hypothetical protein [Dokdonella sp.]
MNAKVMSAWSIMAWCALATALCVLNMTAMRVLAVRACGDRGIASLSSAAFGMSTRVVCNAPSPPSGSVGGNAHASLSTGSSRIIGDDRSIWMFRVQ